MRRFFALALPGAVQAGLGAWMGGPGWRWAEPEGLHLTLAFLGEVPEAAVGPLETAAREVATRHRPFELRSAGLGQFPPVGAPRVLWLGFEPSEPLDALAGDLREVLRRAGVAFNPKPFTPHLTLARRGAGVRPGLPLTPPPAVRWPVAALSLMSSDQGRYRPTGSWALG
ncbi:MAG TPA: RNA 2',3'-cyclic phosphodiesterase [Holophagaceae bacterium]|nr:RNA 2',3'-cyclic phosphodiesterase [Holophagaceae bacterium]